MRCPLCQAELPDDATQCTQCDWVQEPDLPRSQAQDWCAAALSFVPGLGHLYKGHLVPGLLLLCLGGPAFLLLVMLLIPKTFGLSLLLPAAFIAFTAVHAFRLPDARQSPGIREQAIRTLEHWGKLLHH
jgi:hypothetical protein